MVDILCELVFYGTREDACWHKVIKTGEGIFTCVGGGFDSCTHCMYTQEHAVICME